MRNIVKLCLLLVPLLLAARNEPPVIEKPEGESARNLTIYGSGLSISPGTELTYLKFTGGVRCVTDNMELSADVFELQMQTNTVTRGSELKLPKTEVPQERVVEDPGTVVRDMALELEVPSASFSASAIRRVGAAGNVRIQSAGLTMTTAELVSIDGGKSWSASGRSNIHRTEQDSSYDISADFILYDMDNQRALARGNIVGQYSTGGSDPIQLSASQVELDIEESRIQANEQLMVTYRGYRLCCGSLDADIGSGIIHAGDSPRLEDEAHGIVANAAEIHLDLESMVARATGGVNLTDSVRGITMTADELTAELESKRLTATGDPQLTKGESSFSGKRITVFEEDGKTVIEVDGGQHARLNLDDLGQENEKGAPENQEPPDSSEG